MKSHLIFTRKSSPPPGPRATSRALSSGIGSDRRRQAKSRGEQGRGFLAALRALPQGLAATRQATLRSLALAAPLAALALAPSPASAATPNFCPPGSSAGHCNFPMSVAVDQTGGEVYIGEFNNARVSVFDSAGHFLRAFGYGVLDGAEELQTCTTTCASGFHEGGAESLKPGALAVDNSPGPSAGDLYVLDLQRGRVEKYALDPLTERYEELLSFGPTGTGPGRFGGEDPIAVDAEGHVRVGDQERIEEFSETGTLLSEVALPGEGAVSSLALDSSGDFYAINSPTNEIQRITVPASGTYTLTFEGQTTAPIGAERADKAPEALSAELEAALESLSTIGAGNVQGNLSGTEVVFQGSLGGKNVPQLVPSAGSVTTERDGAPGRLRKFGPSGAFLETLDESGNPNSVFVDATGNAFVSDQPEPSLGKNSGKATLREFNPVGEQIEAFGSGEVIGAPEGNALAFGDSAQSLYTVSSTSGDPLSAAQAFSLPRPGPLPVSGTAAGKEIKKLAATLCARVNPEGAETKAHFQYITAAQFEGNVKEGHEGFAGALATAESPSLGEDFSFAHELCLQVSSLEPATAYRFRIVAHNGDGEVDGETAEFSTLPPAAIDSTSAADITADSATLQAEIDPLGDATSYRFEYLTQAAYEGNLAAGGDPFAGAALAPEEEVPLGSGLVDLAVSRHLQGLLSATTYRYRVRIRNAVSEAHGGPFAGPAGAFTTQSAAGAALPDHRAYEQVSPADKHGAQIEGIGAIGSLGVGGVVQAAADGDALTYIASTATESAPQGFAGSAQILSVRDPATGWSSLDIAPPHATAAGNNFDSGQEYRFFSADLSLGLLQPFGAFEGSLSPAASEQTPFLRSDLTPGAPAGFCGSSCYRPLVSGCPAGGECPAAVGAAADVPAGTEFGQETNGECFRTGQRLLFCGPRFLGASPDLAHVVLESEVGLTSAPGGRLYEFSAAAPPLEALRLLNVGPSGGVMSGNPVLGYADSHGSNSRDAISDDGSRVVFSIESGGHLYLRLNATQAQSAISGTAVDGSQCSEPAKACTVQLDALDGGPGAGQSPAAVFQLASADGSRVFFTDTQQLTPDAGSSSHKGGDLYEYDLGRPAGERLTDLTPEGGGESAGVRGFLAGTSKDGSYVYFVADGVLTGSRQNADGEVAERGNCEPAASVSAADSCNLYLRHAGVTVFVARLSAADRSDWGGVRESLTTQTTRVSPDGRWLAFMSQRPLSGYDNHDAASGEPDQEVFLYHSAAGVGGAGSLICASCDPTGARPHGTEFTKEGKGELNMPRAAGQLSAWDNDQWLAANLPLWTNYTSQNSLYQSRYLSDGGRLFFDSSDALVPADSNGQVDVYQYEPPGSAEEAPAGDTCTVTSPTYDPASGGCVDLISSGTSKGESAFLDASESGNDVFFLTAAQLAPTDTDTSLDVYDARSEGGFPASAKPVECSGDACQLPATPPNDATPGSLSFQGAGNVTECPKGKTPKNGKCVARHPKKSKKKKHHKKKSAAKAKKHKRAGSRHGGHK